MKRAAASALAAACLLAGCGGQSDQQAIRNVVDHFTVYVGQGKWASACPLTTGGFRSSCDQFRQAGGLPTSAQCAEVSPDSVAGQACSASQSASAGFSSLTGLTISKVVVSGSSATVAFSGSSEVMTLSKTSDGWRIASA